MNIPIFERIFCICGSDAQIINIVYFLVKYKIV
jgi:hypothetical protein